MKGNPAMSARWGYRRAENGEGEYFDGQWHGQLFEDGNLPEGWITSPMAETETPAPRRRGRPRKAAE